MWGKFLNYLYNKDTRKINTIHIMVILATILLVFVTGAALVLVKQAKKESLTIQEVAKNRIQELDELKIFPWGKKEESKETTTYTVGEVTITKGEGTPWPDSIPSFIPKFASAQITSTAYSAGTWSINYDYISREAYFAYRDTLVKSGWQTDSSVEANGDLLFNGIKDGYVITPILTLEDSSLIICISKGS